MKKIFLSFAALALVAVGTVSCGGDDSSPVKPTTDTPTTDTPTTDSPSTDTPTPTGNKFVVDGVEYTIDANSFTVHGTQSEGVYINQYSYEEGGEAYFVSEWMAEAYPTFEEGGQPSHFIRVYFDVEALDNGDNTFTVQMPNQAENIFPYQILTVKDGALLSDTEYSYGNVSINFNTFDLTENSLNVNYNASETVNGATFNYNGGSGLGISLLYTPPAAQAKGVKNVGKRSQNMPKRSLELNKF